MNNRGFVPIPLVILIMLVLGAGVYFALDVTTRGAPPPSPPKVCTQEAKQCPDGSYVGRTGTNCEFSNCPKSPPVPVPTPGSTGRECAGSSDTNCGIGYECVSKCGPPVARDSDPPPGYFCQPKGYIQICPICLAINTLISTPLGEIPVQNLYVGAPAWTVSRSGERVAGIVIEVSKTHVTTTHQVVELILSDGRRVVASPGHPTLIVGQTVGNIVVTDIYDEAEVLSANKVPYTASFTYDVLISGQTGFYFANGVLLDSTLH